MGGLESYVGVLIYIVCWLVDSVVLREKVELSMTSEFLTWKIGWQEKVLRYCRLRRENEFSFRQVKFDILMGHPSGEV